MVRLRRPPRRPSRRSNYLRAAVRPQWACCLAPPTPASATGRLLGGKIPTSPRSVIVYKYFVLTVVAYIMQVIYINPIILQHPSSVLPRSPLPPGTHDGAACATLGCRCAPPRPHHRCCSRASLPFTPAMDSLQAQISYMSGPYTYALARLVVFLPCRGVEIRTPKCV